MNLFECLCLIYAQFVDFLISLMFRARMKPGGLTKFVRVAVFSLVSVTMISASPTTCGNENGSLKECHGTALESKLHPTGIQNSSSEILHSFSEFLAANNVAVRQGYLNSLEAIPSQINTTAPLREQAMQAFNLRNAAKIDARAAMTDGGALLYKTDPIPTIQDVVRRAYQDKGLVGDDMWRSILESSTRSRASVNQALGVGQ